MTGLLVTENLPTRDLVLAKLRDAILSGRFMPGQRLRERELVALMGVSRTPIREALRKLEMEGLVTTAPYKGPAVAVPTLAEARELFEVRAALEGLAVALLTERVDKATVARLRGHLATARQALARRSTAGLLRANNAFHDAVAAGCGNALVQTMLANLRARVILLRVESLSYPGRRARSLVEHRAILRAIARRQSSEARRLIEEHIMRGWQAAHAQLEHERRTMR